MPYKRKGKVVYVKKSGLWRKKGKAKTIKKAKRYVRLLRGVMHGWRPTHRKR